MERGREDRQRILLKGLHGTPEDLLKVVNEDEFHGYYSSHIRSDDDRCRETLAKVKFPELRKEAAATKMSRKDYQMRVVRLVREYGPEKIPHSWFTRWARGRGKDFDLRMKPYMDVPVAEALKMAREKLRAKEALYRVEEKKLQKLFELSKRLRATPETFRQKVLPHLANGDLRHFILNSVRWDAWAIPVENLRTLVDWELATNPDRHQELYLLMRRPEFTEEMLRHYYPLLVKACTQEHAYHGVRGLIDNPNAPADLFFNDE